MSDESQIHIRLNGEPRSVEEGATLLDLLETLGRHPRTVAVERNGAIVRRQAYGSCHLEEGDKVEIVHFVQGG